MCVKIVFLLHSQQYQLALQEVKVGTGKVSQQMDSLCQQYDWLSDVWAFTSFWKTDKQEDDMSADDFEVRIVSYIPSHGGCYSLLYDRSR